MAGGYAPQAQELADDIPAFDTSSHVDDKAADTTAGPEQEKDLEDSWCRCTLRARSERGGYEVLSPTQTTLIECDDQLVYTQMIEGSKKRVIPTRDVLKFRVLARCQHLTQSAWEKSKTQKAAGRNDMDDEQDLVVRLKKREVAYVGYSMDMKGLMFARANRDGEIDVNEFNFRGLVSDSEPSKPITGAIAHYTLSSKLGIRCLKQALRGESLGDGCNTEMAHQLYKQYVKEFILSMAYGNASNPVAYCRVVGFDPANEGESRLEDATQLASATNPSIDQMTSHAGNFADGFVYQAAYTAILDYPDEIIKILKEFAEKHPEDLLPLTVMLLACHLWVDIVKDENLRLEKLEMDKKRAGEEFTPVPHVPLAAFLLYFAHWLRWTENMGLVQYIHPFRFIHAALLSDFTEEGVSYNNGCIDEERVYILMGQVTSKIPSVHPGQRLDVYPCMMFGSDMPAVDGAKRFRYPKRVQMYLTGLVHVKHYGLDSYVRSHRAMKPGPRLTDMSGKYREILLPKHVDAGLFKSMGTSVDLEDLAKLPKVWIKTGTLAPHFKPNPSLYREISLTPTKLKIPDGWDREMDDKLPSHEVDAKVEELQYHYDRCEAQGLLTIARDAEFYVDRSFRWMPRGMKRMAPEELAKPPRKVIRGPDAPRRPSPVAPDWYFGGLVPMQEPGKEVILDYPEYEDLVKTWSASIPDGAHWAWKAGLEEIKGLEEGSRSEATLRTLVTKAFLSEQRDWNLVQQKVTQFLDGDRAVTLHEVEAVLPLAFGRILGIRPPDYSAGDVWLNCLQPQATEVNRAAVRRIEAILNAFALDKRGGHTWLDTEFDELSGLVDSSTEWMGKWRDFIEVDSQSET
ncbi:hypothetical protein CFAM422_008563 [Trichoderma lentiforme]|uniref:Uncharacterized protein n=1 Tax=Trichoderma lentiforme TaxID=1567552 RepID=A0A9P4XCY0_9HYPO|nr:hypothetical protein CFAM422_008563 [Trichoderma lentiforme]